MTDESDVQPTDTEDLSERINQGIAYFLSTLPPELRDKLDFSQDSLVPIESWLLQHYKYEEIFLTDEDEQLVNGVVFYVGEVYRKHLGGQWVVLPADSEETSGIHFSERIRLQGFYKDKYFSPYEEVQVTVYNRFGGELGELKQTLKNWLRTIDLNEKYGQA